MRYDTCMTITMELAQSIANYLVTKPYQEVAALIAELERQANVKPQENADPSEEKKGNS
jgi:hypothetical protein